MRASAFVYSASRSRVVFGAGNPQRELDLPGARRALLLCTPPQRPQAEAILGSHAIGIYDQAAMHVSIEAARAATEDAKRRSATARWRSAADQLPCGGPGRIRPFLEAAAGRTRFDPRTAAARLQARDAGLASAFNNID